jgi:hypothetical protein
VQWGYGAPADLHIVGAPAGTPPVQSRTEVRQGDPLGMLLFALALQDVLERTQAAAPNAALVAITDDVNVVGRVAALRVAFRELVGNRGMGAVKLSVQRPKCALTRGRRIPWPRSWQRSACSTARRA